MITITAYNWVPDFAKGLVRDLRVRWALEEAGLPYQVNSSHMRKNSPRPTALFNPFPKCQVIGTMMWCSSNLAQSSCTSPARVQHCFQPITWAEPERSPGCSPRLIPSSRSSWASST